VLTRVQVIGTIGAGRIGFRVLQRLVPFDPKVRATNHTVKR
jgi:phosphoglycerate dehydrogenase-like enzyme